MAQVVPMFASCVFLVYSWSILTFLHRLPGWMLHLSIQEILGMFAYALASALVESLTIPFLLVVPATLLPARYFRDKFAAHGTLTMLVVAFWAVVFQYIYASTRKWDSHKMLLWSVLFLSSLLLSWMLVQRLERLEKVLNWLGERLTAFLYIYVPLGLLGLVVVLVRNIS
jgi:hypothetical protein